MPPTNFCANRLFCSVANTSRPGVPLGLNAQRMLVVEDDLELVGRAQVVQASEQLGLGRRQRRSFVIAHAAGAIENVNEVMPFALGEKTLVRT